MKREKEVPAELLAKIKQQNEQASKKIFNRLSILCTIPVRAARMKMLKDQTGGECYRMAIIPSVDVYVAEDPILKEGFLKRDTLAFFVAGTHKVFPYGHVYASSGYICLGNIFVPSAIPERSPAMPLETLFLHNDRNLHHGGSHLVIEKEQVKAVHKLMAEHNIRLSKLAEPVTTTPNLDIIENDEIWVLSADVAEQKPLPEALRIMSEVYDVIFGKDEKTEKEGGNA